MNKLILSICILTLLTSEIKSQTTINLAESTLKVNGLSDEEFYFGFAEGDQIVFNFKELRGKELKEIEIIELPSSSKFMDFKSKKIENKTLTVTNTGIFKFRFKNTSIGGRVCQYKIQRIPESEATSDFNSNVYWRTLYDTTYRTVQEKYLVRKEFVPKSIVPTTVREINSGSNASFKGGTSRISIPVTLPKNTKEWYYEFSASRDIEQLEKTKSSFNLIGQLGTLIDQTGTLSFGIDMLTKPSGTDICNIYLLDFDNSQLFKSKAAFRNYTIGSAENIKSGITKISWIPETTVYLGIKNPDPLYAISVAIEVIAIVLEEEWGTRDVEKMDIRTWKEAYLRN